MLKDSALYEKLKKKENRATVLLTKKTFDNLAA